MKSEFEKFAVGHCGISSTTLHDLTSVYAGYINPTIVEERRLNVAQMDVFSRLMVDRIIFLGCPIDDDVANIIQAQLLSSIRTVRIRISRSISTPRAAWSMQVWASTTRCRPSAPM